MTRTPLVAVAALGLSASAFAQPVMSVSGSCPGVVTIGVTGATANQNVAFITGTLGGSTTLMAGPCVGTTLDISNITLRSNAKANGAGERTLMPNLAAGACATGGQWLDITTCTTSEALSLTPSCPVLDVSWVDTAPVAGPPYMADPVAVGFWTESSVASGLREDFEIEDAAGNIAVPATLGLDFFDASFNIVCSALFDISAATADPLYTAESIDPATGLPSGNAVVPWDPMFLDITGGGFTDCTEIDPAGALGSLLGTGDLRALALGGWGFGYNMISGDMAGDITAIVGAASYASDYDPYIIGESFFGLEYNFAATYDRTCEVTEVDANGFYVLLNKPNGPLAEHGVGFSYWIAGL